MRRWIGAGLGALACAGCPSPGAFQCADDDQCQSGGAAGICQPDGYCSFDDSTCASGQRYGAQSGPLAGQCVGPSSGTGPTSGSTETDPSTSPVSSGAVDPTTTGPDDGDTTHALDPTTTSISAGSTDDGSSDGSTGVAPACTEIYVDDFDNGVIAPLYDQDIGIGMSMTEAGGELRFGFDGVAKTGYSYIGYTYGPLTSHRFWVEQATLLPIPSSATLDMCVATEVWAVCITTFDGEHQGYFGPQDSKELVAGTPADPATARFVALSLVDGEARYEVSGDGTTWQTFHAEPSPFDPADDIYVFLGAGNWEPVDAGGEYAVESLGICEL